jgi:formate dehydrogenase subunit delta
MANQIGVAFAAMPEREAVAGAATHLKLYWTPKMIREIVAFVDSGHAGLNAIAAGAVAALKRDGAG